MYNIPFSIRIVYNRSSNPLKDCYKDIVVMATSRELAIEKVNSYSVSGLFDNVEDDYLEDSLYAVE